jgi:hypothetical protein
MKTLLIIVLILFSTFAQAQYTNLKLEDSQFLFEKVYEKDSLSSKDIEKMLINGVPTIKNLKDFYKHNEIITAKLDNVKIDFRKYGGSWGSSPFFLNHPFFANISIVWKDGKYKVTATNLTFDTGVSAFGVMTCTDIFTKKRGSEIRTNENIITAGKYIEQYLSELFTISRVKKDW